MKFKKFLKSLFIFVLLLPCLVIFSACSINGKSAYELAVENGFNGTVQEWLDSLKGKDGTNGLNGKDATQETSYELWQNAVLNDEYSGSYLDFINEKLTITYDNFSIVANKCLSSTVTVEAYNGTLNSPQSLTYGSGIIYSLDANYNAFIITNYHVAYYNNQNKHYDHFLINMRSNDDDLAFEASFVGASSTYDIAVLYAENCQTLKDCNAKAITVNTNDIKFGEKCFAIGNTNGEGLAITQGCISVDSEPHYTTVAGHYLEHRFIRHSAFILNGNSGGGLFNFNGEFIGLTNGGLKTSNNSVMGYLAIPASVIYGATENIIFNCFNTPNKKLEVYDLGLNFESSSSQMKYNETTGFVDIVEDVILSSKQNLTGLNLKDIEVGDKLVKVEIVSNTTITKNIDRLFNYEDILLLIKPNDTIKLTLSRNGETPFEVSLSANDFETKTII